MTIKIKINCNITKEIDMDSSKSQVSKVVQMTEKTCTKCLEVKSLTEFYVSVYTRSECKKCTVAHNCMKQKSYKEKYPNEESKEKRNQYQRDYYSMNKDKMKEYRDAFNEKNPGYRDQYRRAKIQASKPENPDEKRVSIG